MHSRVATASTIAAWNCTSRSSAPSTEKTWMYDASASRGDTCALRVCARKSAPCATISSVFAAASASGVSNDGPAYPYAATSVGSR